jgi:hypothetical protein
MDEPINRLLTLTDTWPRVCIGSTAEYADVMSLGWERRMDQVFNELAQRHRHLPWIHMLRGMQLSGRRWPFASVDSTDVGQNHHRPQNSAANMVHRWDAMQCGVSTWKERPQQLELI